MLSEPLYTALILGVLSFLTETERSAALKGYPLWMGVSPARRAAFFAMGQRGASHCGHTADRAPSVALSVEPEPAGCPELEKMVGALHGRCAGGICPSGAGLECRLSVRIGEEPSHTPGYSLLVGLNPDSGGRWNQEDSDRLYGYSDQPGATAQWTQEQLLADAEARILSGEIDFSKLLKQNCATFWI